MTLFSSRLRLALQETGENDGTWGDVVNNGVSQLLEDSVAGRISIVANASPRTLTTAQGATDEARYMILGVTGAPGVDLDLNIPALSKVYLVDNQLTGGFTVNIGVSGNTRAAVSNGITAWVWCDGTDTFVVEVQNAVNATNATTATNATQLGGVAAASYARLDVQQGFTAAQHTGRSTLSESGGNISVNSANSNAYRIVLDGNFNLNNPTNGADGQVLRILFIQDPTGNRTLTFGSKYAFPGGSPPVLSTGANAVDLGAWEYDQTLDLWFGNVIKNLS